MPTDSGRTVGARIAPEPVDAWLAPGSAVHVGFVACRGAVFAVEATSQAALLRGAVRRYRAVPSRAAGGAGRAPAVAISFLAIPKTVHAAHARAVADAALAIGGGRALGSLRAGLARSAAVDPALVPISDAVVALRRAADQQDAGSRAAIRGRGTGSPVGALRVTASAAVGVGFVSGELAVDTAVPGHTDPLIADERQAVPMRLAGLAGHTAPADPSAVDGGLAAVLLPIPACVAVAIDAHKATTVALLGAALAGAARAAQSSPTVDVGLGAVGEAVLAKH